MEGEFFENTNIAKLNEKDFTFEITENSEELIFGDFDRIFEMVKKAENLSQTKYDIFGHSAGGQILHRLAIFHPSSKANRIIAANSGFYTLPDLNTKLPFGIQNSFLKTENLKQSFNANLTLLIGELDNENETSGTLLRSESADKQGLHRLERGRYFYKKSKEAASKIGTDFNWKIEIVPNIGHNHRKMGQAAAKLLYGE